jgi:predicted amidophosphoribosyltransferase
MRERHFPRVCRVCRAPMARQEDTCWRCGTQWASEDQPRTTLRVIAGGARDDPPDPAMAVAVRAAYAHAARSAERAGGENEARRGSRL